ncbi:uncharacterized protein DS421_11g342970 [Arachis hypogaea]|nr:uncharacterized protein DS421_11g342970 [Arachis hypogaea]
MSLRRFNSAANDGSRSSSSSSKKMKAKKLDGRCFCGRETRDCKYFVWVDEVEEGWEGIARCLARRHSEISYARHDDEFTVTEPGKNQQAPSILARKIDKFGDEIRGEIREIRVLLLWIALGLHFV